MTHNAPKSNACAYAAPNRPILRRLAVVAGAGACAFVLSLPLASQDATADWQTTFRRDGDNWVETTRWVNPEFGGVHGLDRDTTPGNNCPVPAFEVLNPRRGEIRCVGYVRPW